MQRRGEQALDHGVGELRHLRVGQRLEQHAAAVDGAQAGPGPERDDVLRESLPRFENATVTEGRMGEGFYEAVISTLAERR